MTQKPLIFAVLAATAVALAGCPEAPAPTTNSAAPMGSQAMASASAVIARPLPPMPKAPALAATPVGLAELKVPADNALTPEKVMLGKQLFFDKRLSKDGTASCETCHVPEKGWTDGTALSKKVGGAMNVRHSPTMLNVGYNDAFYGDGRGETLEKTAEAAWKGQLGADPAVIAAALAKIPLYQVEFKAVFNTDPTPDAIAKALASFIRTLRSGGSPWDLYEKGDKKAASESAVRGFEIFRNKAGCAQCHAPPAYTDNGYHDTGIGFEKLDPDLGRGKIAKDEKLEGAFKTPTLRSVTTRAPYFHDGRAATLDAAVDFMLSGGIKEKNKNLDAKLKAVKLAPKEREDLLAFLKALEAPTTPFELPTIPE